MYDLAKAKKKQIRTAMRAKKNQQDEARNAESDRVDNDGISQW